MLIPFSLSLVTFLFIYTRNLRFVFFISASAFFLFASCHSFYLSPLPLSHSPLVVSHSPFARKAPPSTYLTTISKTWQIWIRLQSYKKDFYCSDIHFPHLCSHAKKRTRSTAFLSNAPRSFLSRYRYRYRFLWLPL